MAEEVVKIDPDVLCLQEMWPWQARKYLLKKLTPFGFKYAFRPRAWLRLNGLLTLSKKEILSTKSFVFKPLVKGFDFSFFELLGAKGYSLVKIKLSEKEEIFVFNVHLSVDWNYDLGKDSKFALAKLKEIDLLSTAINALGKQKIIVVGDFNFDPGTFFYKRLLKSGVKNISLDKNSHMKTALPNLYKFYVPRCGEEIDLVFSKNLPKNSVLDFKVLWTKPFEKIGYLSDHAAILVKFKDHPS